MLRQALIHKPVVRRQQIEHVAVFPNHAVEKQLGFAPHGTRQIAVEVRKHQGVRQSVFEVLQIQPLRGEICGQGFGARVGQHAARLFFQHGVVAQPARRGQGEQFFVRRAAPQEIGQP